MARLGTKILDTGDAFPDLKLKTLDGSEIQTKTGLKNEWNVVLFYRGSWCPFCKAQLKSFQNGLEKLSAEGIGVLAISVDPLEKAKETQKETGATFPIAIRRPRQGNSGGYWSFLRCSANSYRPLSSVNGLHTWTRWKSCGCSL